MGLAMGIGEGCMGSPGMDLGAVPSDETLFLRVCGKARSRLCRSNLALPSLLIGANSGLEDGFFDSSWGPGFARLDEGVEDGSG
jgi:hypothetical protein